MEIRNRLYPYPVLAKFTEDYKTGNFSVKMISREDGYDHRFDFKASLTSPGLQELINTGKAKFVYHFECNATGFRQAVQTSEAEVSCSIPGNRLKGKMQICSFIVATEDIPSFALEDFDDDYNGMSFFIEAGCILAVGESFSVQITKADEFASGESIFSIVKNCDSKVQEMQVELTSRKIVVKLPEKDFQNYQSLITNPAMEPVLSQLVLTPALIYTLQELRRMDQTEMQMKEDELWYRALSSLLKQKFHCDINSDEFDSIEPVSLAQRLIERPLSRAFEQLTSGFAENEEEE